jgi:hypothetical protein
MNTETIARADITVGMDVTARFLPGGNRGHGGVVVTIHDDRFTMESGTDRYIHDISFDEVAWWEREVPYEADECLNFNEDCRGPVDLHWTGGTRSWPRCEFHQDRRMASRETSMERYADSDVTPSWFDEADAGERWSDDY